jgi:hypothetical protein
MIDDDGEWEPRGDIDLLVLLGVLVLVQLCLIAALCDW